MHSPRPVSASLRTLLYSGRGGEDEQGGEFNLFEPLDDGWEMPDSEKKRNISRRPPGEPRLFWRGEAGVMDRLVIGATQSNFCNSIFVLSRVYD